MGSLKNRLNTNRKPSSDESEPTVLTEFNTTYPSHQNAIDLFAGEWASKFPASAEVTSAGFADLFEDARMDWLIEKLGGSIKGKKVLELGPLEAGHTYLLDKKYEADEVLAIEAKDSAYIKCLIAKEILNMKNSKFLLGDFNKYMEKGDIEADLLIASGILYHMDNPAEHIKLLCSTCDTIFVWTHYYDDDIIQNGPEQLSKKFTHHEATNFEGCEYTLHRQDYLDALGWDGFCGAGVESTYWLTKEDITNLFNHNGFDITDVGFEGPDHPNGPAFAFIAQKQTS